MRFILIILFILSPTVFAREFTLNTTEGERKIDLIKDNGAYISKKCKMQNCLALQSLKKQVRFKTQSKIRRHPASQACFNLGGKNIILKDEDKNEWDFCYFSDNSMISSWDMYKKVGK